jgi:DNA replication protein DnaC
MKLQYLTKQLHLSAVYRHCHGLAREAIEMQITYEQYLISVLEQEVRSRDETMKKARIKQAQFRQIKTLDTYNFSVMPDLNKPKVISLTDGEYIRKKENVFFIGKTGTGKSHLAVSLGMIACNQGYRVRFIAAADLVNALIEAHNEYRLPKYMATWKKMNLIILDEVGFVPFSKLGSELLFQFCSSIYETCSLIITSNLNFSEWPTVFGDETLTSALLDRLIHHAQIFVMNGDSYRLRESLRNAIPVTKGGGDNT